MMRPSRFCALTRELIWTEMSYDTPLSASGQQMADLKLREQLRRGFKDMGSRSYSSAKNFGMIGAMYAGTECCIEGVRRLFAFSSFLSLC